MGGVSNSVIAGWSPPEAGFVKFNVVGVVKDNKAGCGGALWTEKGQIRALFMDPVDIFGDDFAGLIFVKLALKVFVEANWIGKAPLIMELDSKRVIYWIQNAVHRPWNWWSILVIINKLVKKIGQVHFVYASNVKSALALGLARDGPVRANSFKARW
ncbi:hypothetical protein F3Y22_tig00112921pilonHSYRG00048 [Hibiscus syriacus]|uniref:RNase H type-1 domain-containing protein n=1 Tax=Hibiscus syriacus TaxID=106335 RepID=A0A6A2XNW0_HIBSY|nr:hypothetical protein F3Y22_tig00112921pilonHSYRG00048 [Hibiscus syriacus]